MFYGETGRLREAEAAYEEALLIRRSLAKTNATAYQPGVATTLNDLSTLYRKGQRLHEANTVG